MLKQKYDIEYIKQYAKDNEIVCLEDEYKNISTPMRWKCQKNHIWTAQFRHIRAGGGCRQCFYDSMKLSIEECFKVAHDKGFKCLETRYVNARHLMRWECRNGHQWSCGFDSLKNKNTGCPYCLGLVKHTLKDCQNLASSKNGVFLSDNYTNVSEKYLWQCRNNHQWLASYSNINAGHWCPYCAGNLKNTIEDCHKLAKEKDGRFLSKEYISCHSRYTWECYKGHQWKASYSNINRGHWCPHCSRGLTQQKLFKIVKEIFPEKGFRFYQNYRNLNWLKNKETGKNLEIDILIEEEETDLKIGIEYNGRQHYHAVDYFGGERYLKYVQGIDKIKRRLIKENKDKLHVFIEFSYVDTIEKEPVLRKLESHESIYKIIKG